MSDNLRFEFGTSDNNKLPSQVEPLRLPKWNRHPELDIFLGGSYLCTLPLLTIVKVRFDEWLLSKQVIFYDEGVIIFSFSKL